MTKHLIKKRLKKFCKKDFFNVTTLIGNGIKIQYFMSFVRLKMSSVFKVMWIIQIYWKSHTWFLIPCLRKMV